MNKLIFIVVGLLIIVNLFQVFVNFKMRQNYFEKSLVYEATQKELMLQNSVNYRYSNEKINIKSIATAGLIPCMFFSSVHCNSCIDNSFEKFSAFCSENNFNNAIVFISEGKENSVTRFARIHRWHGKIIKVTSGMSEIFNSSTPLIFLYNSSNSLVDCVFSPSKIVEATDLYFKIIEIKIKSYICVF